MAVLLRMLLPILLAVTSDPPDESAPSPQSKTLSGSFPQIEQIAGLYNSSSRDSSPNTHGPQYTLLSTRQ